ncbi:MAG: type II secretion system protein GspG, partial [Planctomycetales bacterium]|nr:type II secretion system protein GspG [Planctomycetales bacterium]
PLDGHINRTEDAWGNSLKYSYDNTGLFRLESLGANGLLGGEGDNRDVARSFRWQNESGVVLSDEAFWASERSIP